MESIGLTIFRAIGYGLGITALTFTAYALIAEPVLIVEQDIGIRIIELAGIVIGIVSLLRQLLIVKR